MLVTLVVILAVVASANGKTCSGRGGCDCDCSWVTSAACKNDDGSCCWGCCCSTAAPTPQPPARPPGPTPPPGPAPSHSQYCPSARDLVVGYGSPNIFDGGWSQTGGGATATKASFNLLGGSVEYDIDLSKTKTGINANIYSIGPSGISRTTGFTQNNYCDGSKPAGSSWCTEVDWIESNGNCGGATALHTVPGPGTNGCTAWGCKTEYSYNGVSSFHMKVTFGTDGTWTTYRDGKVISGSSLSPKMLASDIATLVKSYSTQGAVIYSSQWQGWVPMESCGTSGNLASSTFKISNLRITGTVLQGPTPTTCKTTPATPTPPAISLQACQASCASKPGCTGSLQSVGGKSTCVCTCPTATPQMCGVSTTGKYPCVVPKGVCDKTGKCKTSYSSWATAKTCAPC